MSKESKRTEGKLGITPLPWEVRLELMDRYSTLHIDGKAEDGSDTVCDMNGEWVKDERRRANANFIVNAVNNHDGLVEALRNIASVDKSFVENNGGEEQAIMRMIDEAQKALKEAEEKTK